MGVTEPSLCSGSLRVMAANNDAEVRIFDAENFACLNRFTYPWSVNVSILLQDDLIGMALNPGAVLTILSYLAEHLC